MGRQGHQLAASHRLRYVLVVTKNVLTVMRVIGWALVPIGFAITFIPSYFMSVWTGDTFSYYSSGFGDPDGPWGINTVRYCAGMLVLAAIVMIVGLALVVLSRSLVPKREP